MSAANEWIRIPFPFASFSFRSQEKSAGNSCAFSTSIYLLFFVLREKFIVNRLYSFGQVFSKDEAGNADLRGADDIDIDIGSAKCAEHTGSDSRFAEHAAPTTETLAVSSS